MSTALNHLVGGRCGSGGFTKPWTTAANPSASTSIFISTAAVSASTSIPSPTSSPAIPTPRYYHFCYLWTHTHTHTPLCLPSGAPSNHPPGIPHSGVDKPLSSRVGAPPPGGGESGILGGVRERAEILVVSYRVDVIVPLHTRSGGTIVPRECCHQVCHGYLVGG